MNKYEQVVLMSMQSTHALNVTNGDKLRELRKTIPRGYRGWVYIYCTKGKPYIMTQDNKFLATLGIKNQELNGKVIGRFWYDEHDEIKWLSTNRKDYEYHCFNKNQTNGWRLDNPEYLKLLQLTADEVEAYGFNQRKNKQEKLYALHVKKMDVVIPMDLSDFYIGNPDRENVGAFGWAFTQEEMPDYIPLDKAPRSWQYAYLKGEVI